MPTYSPVPSFELKAELAAGHYLHLKYGQLCYGEELKKDVIHIRNVPFLTDEDSCKLIALIQEAKDPVFAVQLFLKEKPEVKAELVIGSPCSTALWFHRSLAKFPVISQNSSPNLQQLNQALRFYRFSSGNSFPEVLPLARIPDLANFNERMRVIFYSSEETGVVASRYCDRSTHNYAVESLWTERIFCGVETKSYNILSCAFSYFKKEQVLCIYIPKERFEISLEKKCLHHFQEVMAKINPEIKVHCRFEDHSSF